MNYSYTKQFQDGEFKIQLVRGIVCSGRAWLTKWHFHTPLNIVLYGVAWRLSGAHSSRPLRPHDSMRDFCWLLDVWTEDFKWVVCPCLQARAGSTASSTPSPHALRLLVITFDPAIINLCFIQYIVIFYFQIVG